MVMKLNDTVCRVGHVLSGYAPGDKCPVRLAYTHHVCDQDVRWLDDVPAVATVFRIGGLEAVLAMRPVVLW